MSMKQFDKGYEPHEVEKRWYEYWENEQLFAAQDQSPQAAYSIVIPPPNVTGVLHMGHALNNTMQDIMCRYRRLRGDNVLWMPGTDHAGIAPKMSSKKNLPAKAAIVINWAGKNLSRPSGSGAKNTAVPSSTS